MMAPSAPGNKEQKNLLIPTEQKNVLTPADLSSTWKGPRQPIRSSKLHPIGANPRKLPLDTAGSSYIEVANRQHRRGQRVGSCQGDRGG